MPSLERPGAKKGVRAPHSERERIRRRGKARRKGGVKDTMTADYRGQFKSKEVIGRIILWEFGCIYYIILWECIILCVCIMLWESAAIPHIFAIALCRP